MYLYWSTGVIGVTGVIVLITSIVYCSKFYLLASHVISNVILSLNSVKNSF